jgi:uncharacterized protein YjiS (DUF1127 family)
MLNALANTFRALVDMPRRRALIDELSMLSDHELADIGLNRAELDRVFDRDFTAARGNYRKVATHAARI